jgi:hypothetical protein|tara:strand:+ start:606 stop:758 length:153 start_codon:yes stop_codon:yes gene_type:complete
MFFLFFTFQKEIDNLKILTESFVKAGAVSFSIVDLQQKSGYLDKSHAAVF